jgi:alkanesulfonate monooxygenase SsuD/methylene tetrahydromethanopterin reductase-like flavin-dependent oxidoreductase (luciferase family)
MRRQLARHSQAAHRNLRPPSGRVVVVVVVTDSFEEACNKADAEKNKAPAKEDWRAKFSRLSNEALAKAEEKSPSPSRMKKN